MKHVSNKDKATMKKLLLMLHLDKICNGKRLLGKSLEISLTFCNFAAND